MKQLVVGLMVGLLGSVFSVTGLRADNVVKTGYETGYDDIVRICRELHQALEPKERQDLMPQPVYWKQLTMPYIQPGLHTDQARNWRAVHLSAGFVDFLNQLSHARAIDVGERGFLKKYLKVLAVETGDRPLVGLPAAVSAKAWSFDTMNYQVSHFNQMAGGLIAINMAFHTLGYYDKYASQLVDSQNHVVPINQVIKESEWRKAVLKGAREALSCGYGVEGLCVLFEAIDDLPHRPAWTLYFVPEGVKASKVRRDLQKLEKKFFMLD